MPTLTIRQLDETTVVGLKQRAEMSGRSMEAEVRAILQQAVNGRMWGRRWIEAVKDLRGEEIPIPPRSMPRELPDFS